MTAAELIFEGQTFQIARRSLIKTCELFVENPNLLSTRYRIRSRVSEAHFRLFLAAIEGATTEIGMENAMDLESLSTEFQFIKLGQRVGEFVSQHPHVEDVRLRSAISDLQQQLAGQNRELCQLTEAMVEVRRQIEGVAIKLNQTEDSVERRVGPLKRAALGLAETKDRMSRVESDVAGLRAATADGSAKLADVRQEVAGLRAQFSDRCPKVNRDMANLQQELAKLKEEIRTMKPKPELLARPAADVAVPPAPNAATPARKSSNSSPPPNVAPPPPKPAPVTVWPPAPPRQAKQFPPSIKKGPKFDLPDGIIAHLARGCGGNVHNCHIVEVTSGSFEKETQGANPHSGAYKNDPATAAKNAADLETGLSFSSAYRFCSEAIPHTRNN
jgi:uncharacterized protein YukE